MLAEYEVLKTNAKGLVNGVDYEIVTVQIVDDEVNYIPYGRYFKSNVLKLVNEERTKSIKDIVSEKLKDRRNVLYVESTMPLKEGQELFLIEAESLDCDTAMDLGFGVVKMLKGDFADKYFLYNSDNNEKDVPLLLDVYLEIAVKEYHNINLQNLISSDEGKMMLWALKFSDDKVVVQKLNNAFAMKGGGGVVH